MKEKTKVTKTQVFLTILYTSILLISNIIAGKLIKLPFSFFGLNYITCAVIVFPITCILSDVFSEVYGYKWSRTTCYIGFIMNLIMVGFFWLAINIPAIGFWGGQAAFKDTLGSTWYMLVASFTAYMMGDLLNDVVFAKIKDKYHKDDNKKFGIRAVLSTLCGQLLDSSIYLPLGFGLLPLIFGGDSMTWGDIGLMIILQAFVKTLYEFITLPVTNIVVKKIALQEKKVAAEDEVEIQLRVNAIVKEKEKIFGIREENISKKEKELKDKLLKLKQKKSNKLKGK